VVALGTVVLGHWLVIDVAYRRGELTGSNVLGQVPYTHWLTLGFQAMPVFFLAGGYANAASWSRHRGAGGHWPAWLQRRIAGLAWPTSVYVGAVTAVVAVLLLLDLDARTLSLAAWLVALHLWFLSVYLVLLVLAPAQVAAHRRWGLAVPLALAAAVAVVDIASLGRSVDLIGWANYVLVWGLVHQLGVAWQQGDLTRRRALPIGVGTAGLATLVGLVWWGPYPLSMVGVPGADIQNTSPPSLALLAHACVQAGLLVAAETVVSRRLERPASGARVRAANRLAITVYLWHMVPVVLVAATVYPTGVVPHPEAGGLPWWLLRLLWVGTLSAVLGLLVRALLPVVSWQHRLPWHLGRPHRAAGLAVLAGSAALSVALARLAVDGFAPDNRLPWPTLALCGTGFLLVLLSGAHAGTLTRRRDAGRSSRRRPGAPSS
jgi:hypothetical protein